MLSLVKYSVFYTLTAATSLCVCVAGCGGSVECDGTTFSSACSVLEIGESPNIRVSQFGYLEATDKVVVLRTPEDPDDDVFEPGSKLSVIEVESGESVFEGSVSVHGDGDVDPSSGDRAWWFDFSSLRAPGDYVIVDTQNGVRSVPFRIANDVYDQLLIASVKTFFYQRAGTEKAAAAVGEAWADSASHLGPLQDLQARLYSAPDDALTELDLSGGWYDAGDYNKYTNWHADYVMELLHTFEETSSLWGDDHGIPESGNGIPDILDEALFGLEFLRRAQLPTGAVISVVDLDQASPPSTATGPSLYGPASTSATLSTSAAFALAAIVLNEVPELDEQATDFANRALTAFNWAETNPGVVFQNNVEENGSTGIGAGQQEVDDLGRVEKRLRAAALMFELTNTEAYRAIVDALYPSISTELLETRFISPFSFSRHETLLRYASLPNATPAVSATIFEAYADALDNEHQLSALEQARDPYRAYIKDYTWGSNNTKARQGLMLLFPKRYGLLPSKQDMATAGAYGYLHYLHGVNPLGLVYLTNTQELGAENSVTKMFHAWFSESEAGPPPGFLVGGPNPQYSLDACCPSDCFNEENNARCDQSFADGVQSEPPQKAYRDRDDGWPLNTWELSENSNGYQVSYIRLLANLIQSARAEE